MADNTEEETATLVIMGEEISPGLWNAMQSEPGKYDGLLKDPRKYAEIAGIGGNPELIFRPCEKVPELSGEDLDAVGKIFKLKKELNAYGYYFTGCKAGVMSKKFMAITGVLIRNLKDAHYCPLGIYLSKLMNEGRTNHRVTLIPDFIPSHVTKKENESSYEKIPNWKKDLILAHLMEKQSEDCPMLLGMSDSDDLEYVYGADIASFILENYIAVKS